MVLKLKWTPKGIEMEGETQGDIEADCNIIVNNGLKVTGTFTIGGTLVVNSGTVTQGANMKLGGYSQTGGTFTSSVPQVVWSGNYGNGVATGEDGDAAIWGLLR